jgi:dCTP deaminase
MTVLSDAGIKRSIEQGTLSIDPFSEEALTPNGYDLSMAELMLPDGDARVCGDAGHLDIPPMSRVVISTLEYLRLPGNMSAQLWLRTRWSRRGLLATFGKVDAGFEGTITIGAFHCGGEPLRLVLGDRVCQVCFELLDENAQKEYAGRSGTWQGQRGIVIQPPSEDGDGRG